MAITRKIAGIFGAKYKERVKIGIIKRILGALQPRLVLASHFDDFFVPLEAPAGFSLNPTMRDSFMVSMPKRPGGCTDEMVASRPCSL